MTETAKTLTAGTDAGTDTAGSEAQAEETQQGRKVRSKTEWAVLDELRKHYYDTRTRGSKPDDPGWHPCTCGWEGYWCDWQPHVAEKITATLPGDPGAGTLED